MTNSIPMPVELRERSVNGVMILCPERGLKGRGEAVLRERLDRLVREGKLEILIDLQQMPFVDSTELGRLIRCHISVRNAGGRVRLCNLSPRVITLMKMSRLDTLLEIYDTEDEALAVIVQQREQQSDSKT